MISLKEGYINLRTIKEDVTAQIVEKKSKFIANIFYVSSEEEAQQKLLMVRKQYHDARHNCYAYRIQKNEETIEKSSDDGEPSGTAGAPMLNLLVKEEMINILVVVTRYFGGILLGTGGLVRAYTEATKEALQNAIIVSEEPGLELKVILPYQDFERFKYYCQTNEINIIESSFSNEVCCIIEISLYEKRKIIDEIEEKQFNIQNLEIVKEKNIRK